ncbi:DUF3006 domain-containing protein [Wansuia hejianensis]|uniref:DUF3006 domain-containing protein n=1 Tax=Wansuia hejianensis TaxID=2763667 RepID=A0A926EWV4_9FIRM|nr:DUF3006 domain-containing protein [Wansuia hejianensis]
MKVIIDRFEGEFALLELEDREIIDIPKRLLPEEAKEGDIIKIIIDEEETQKRKEQIQRKFNSLLAD